MKSIVLDIEATGLDVALDRIVQLGMAIYLNGVPQLGYSPDEVVDLLVNPERTMSPEVIEIHHITNEMVATKPPFSEFAADVYAELEGATIIGYNLWRFDLPLLHEEFHRCGIKWDWSKHDIIDVGNIFKKREPRDLESAVEFYCGREMKGAHDAVNDAFETGQVLAGQIQRYADLQTKTLKGLVDEGRLDNNIDLAGKLVRNKDGVPCFNFGKSKGKPVAHDIGFANWMFRADFTADTLDHLQRILDEIHQ